MYRVNVVAVILVGVVEVGLRPDVGAVGQWVNVGTTKDDVAALKHLLIVALVEIEARSKGVGSLTVEVVLGLLIDCVVDQWQASLEVGLDLVVGLGKSATLVVRFNGCLGLGDIRDTIQRSAQFWSTVGHAEEVGKHEVAVGTGNERLALNGLQLVAVLASCLKLLYLLEHLVASGDRAVVSLPESRWRVAIVDAADVFPCKGLVVIAVVGLQVVAHTVNTWRVVVDEVIGRQLTNQSIVVAWIGTSHQHAQLLSVGESHTRVAGLVKEVATRRQSHQCHTSHYQIS